MYYGTEPENTEYRPKYFYCTKNNADPIVLLTPCTSALPLPCATAVGRHWTDPADVAAARKVLARVHSAEANLAPAQVEELPAIAFSHVRVRHRGGCEPLAKIWAASVLDRPSEAEGKGVADAPLVPRPATEDAPHAV